MLRLEISKEVRPASAHFVQVGGVLEIWIIGDFVLKGEADMYVTFFEGLQQHPEQKCIRGPLLARDADRKLACWLSNQLRIRAPNRGSNQQLFSLSVIFQTLSLIYWLLVLFMCIKWLYFQCKKKNVKNDHRSFLKPTWNWFLSYQSQGISNLLSHKTSKSCKQK